MKGQVFGLDAVVAVIIALASIQLVALTFLKVGELVSEDIVYRRLEVITEKALATLLLADAPWRCYVGGVPVPGCVIESTYAPQKNRFFLQDVNCYLEGSQSLAELMGCGDPPSDPLISFSKEFNACLTSSPPQCQTKTLRLTVWIGR